LHLVQRKRHSQAPSHPPAKRRPLIPYRFLPKKTLGAELQRLREQILAEAGHENGVEDKGPDRKGVTADGEWLPDDATARAQQDRPEAHRFLEGCIHILELWDVIALNRQMT